MEDCIRHFETECFYSGDDIPKFKKYAYGFDSGYYIKTGLTHDNLIYVLEVNKFTDDEVLIKALDEHVITVDC